MSSTAVLATVRSNRSSAAVFGNPEVESRDAAAACFLDGAGVGVSMASDSSASDEVKWVSRLANFLGGSVSTVGN